MAMMLALLIAATTSSALPGEAPAVFAPDVPPRLGHVLLGFNPAALGIDDAASKVDRYIAALLADSSAVRVPVAHRREARARAQIQGVIVPGWLLDDLPQPNPWRTIGPPSSTRRVQNRTGCQTTATVVAHPT